MTDVIAVTAIETLLTAKITAHPVVISTVAVDAPGLGLDPLTVIGTIDPLGGADATVTVTATATATAMMIVTEIAIGIEDILVVVVVVVRVDDAPQARGQTESPLLLNSPRMNVIGERFSFNNSLPV